MAWASESDLFMPRCLRNISAICQPTGKTGLSADSASWKTIEISGPTDPPPLFLGHGEDVVPQ